MTTVNKEILQKKVNEMYPLNHCFDLDTLRPTNNETRERADFFLSPFLKILIRNKVILDVGTNKGLFALWSIENGAKQVIAQDTVKDYPAMLGEIAEYKNLTKDKILCSTDSLTQFFMEGDLAYVFGVCHYLTYEDRLNWIYRLFIMGYDLLIEFPFYQDDPVVKENLNEMRRGQRQIKDENWKFLDRTLFMEKTRGLYDVQELGKCPGNRRTLFYCKKIPLPVKNLLEIDRQNFTPLSMTQNSTVMRKDSQVLKLNHKWEFYPGRWIRGHQILNKEFPEIIPNVHCLIRDEHNKIKGMIQEFCPPGKNIYPNLFKIQNFLISIHMLMVDLHPNHIHGTHVIDLEHIENLSPETERQLRIRVLEESWKKENFTDKNLNEETVKIFMDEIRSGKCLREIFSEAEHYSWSK